MNPSNHEFPCHFEFFDSAFNKLMFQGQLVHALTQLQLEMLIEAPKTVKIPTSVQLRYLLSYAAHPKFMFKPSGQYTLLKSTSISQQILVEISLLLQLAGIAPCNSHDKKPFIGSNNLDRHSNNENSSDKANKHTPEPGIDLSQSEQSNTDLVRIFYSLFDIALERQFPTSYQTLETAPFKNPETLSTHRGGSRRRKAHDTTKTSLGSHSVRQNVSEQDTGVAHDTNMDPSLALQILGLDHNVDQETKDKYIYTVPHSSQEYNADEGSDLPFHRLYAENLLYVWGAKFKDNTEMPVPTYFDESTKHHHETRTFERLSIGFISWILQYSTYNTAFGYMRYSQLSPILNIVLSILEHNSAHFRAPRRGPGEVIFSEKELINDSIFDSWVIGMYNSFVKADLGTDGLNSGLLISTVSVNANVRKSSRNIRYHGSADEATKTIARISRYFVTLVMSNQQSVSAPTVLSFKEYLFPQEIRHYEALLAVSDEPLEKSAKQAEKKRNGDPIPSADQPGPSNKRQRRLTVADDTRPAHSDPITVDHTDNTTKQLCFGDSTAFRVRLINLIIASWSKLCHILFRGKTGRSQAQAMFPKYLMNRLFAKVSATTIESILCSSLLSFDAREALVSYVSDAVLGVHDIYDQQLVYDALVSDLSVLPGSLVSPSSPSSSFSASFASPSSSFTTCLPLNFASIPLSKDTATHYQYVLILKALIFHLRCIDDQHLETWVAQAKLSKAAGSPLPALPSRLKYPLLARAHESGMEKRMQLLGISPNNETDTMEETVRQIQLIQLQIATMLDRE